MINRIISMRKYTFLLSQLVKRDFMVKYRGSVLGVLWSVLNPLLTMLILSIVFGQIFHAVENYRVYLLSGIVLFNFFSEATNLATNAIVRNFGLVTKVYIPKYILPVANVISSVITLLCSVAVFIIISMLMNVAPWWGYILIPYVLICLIVFTIGISLILSTIDVFFRDTQHLYSVISMMWMYLTPILYDLSIIPERFRPYFKANPLTIFITFFRDITLGRVIPSATSFLLCAVCAAVSLLIGALVFRAQQGKFIYYA